ncbi:unnamed protein product (macronuclear) [Paramecium tetraurelia]|uniref:Uncharacterized protein n=1 Tax=Paramecium tetraurelia TaxID=5888 RepID=A0C4P5_PARTE|nr:uncharacterized protein GSPATT00006261001 [Paramecium tetraurelia]CAK65762.1 unnamed protein product [Paramecium tetraurelia]|eukprot:XP_001433159.1 hypothetical protein (macronuclear) [Paramecium tetraurelia strain d4-2]
MHQQPRLSPVSSSPLHQNQIITCNTINQVKNKQTDNNATNRQHPIPNSHKPKIKSVYVSFISLVWDPQQQLKERDAIIKQQLITKGVKSQLQSDGQSKSSSIQISQTNQNTCSNANLLQCTSYIDEALKSQREEFLKLIEQQNKQIEILHQQQQIIMHQERKKEQDYETQLCQIKNQLKQQINSKCNEIFNKIQKQQQSDFKHVEAEIAKLTQQINQFSNLTKVQLSSSGKENQQQEHQDKLEYNNNSIINSDLYIKKFSYESINQKTNDLKLPEQISILLNSNNQSNSEIQEIEILQSELTLLNASNQIRKDLNHENMPSSLKTIITKRKDYQSFEKQDSPFKNLNEQDMLDSLDDIVIQDSGQQQSNKKEFNLLKSQGMSVIQEDEDDDEELIYQIDENGFILTQDGHPLIDEKGKRIQLTKQEMQFYKVQTLN